MYYIIYGFLYLLSLLPLWFLYIISNGIRFLLHRVFKYRRHVILNNLKIIVPDKTEEELQKIIKNFYRNFCDTWIETIKITSLSENNFKKKVTGNFELLDELANENRVIQLLAGHFFNWEYANLAFSAYIKQMPYLGVYMPLKNKAFDKFFFNLRSKYGTILLPATTMKNAMMPWRNKQYVIALGADQSTGNAGAAYWVNFFNKPTAFVKGPEKNCRLNNAIQVYTEVKKLKRGHYHLHFSIITKNAELEPEGNITKKYANLVEKNVLEDPALYLLSHKRWKLEWKEEYTIIP